MTKKLALIGVVLLLLVGGGIFLFVKNKGLSGDNKGEYVNAPTAWSQPGDYESKQVDGQTVVTNKKAGFSFKVPVGWRIKNLTGREKEEYIFDMRSPNAKFQEDQYGNNAMLNGCVIDLETEFQKDTVDSILIGIESVKTGQKEGKRPKESMKLIKIGQLIGLETFFMPPLDTNYYKTFGSNQKIEIPVNVFTVIRFGIQIAPHNEASCENSFSDFAKNITIGT